MYKKRNGAFNCCKTRVERSEKDGSEPWAGDR